MLDADITNLETKYTGKLHVIYRFKIAHVGWELDTESVIVEDSHGRRHCILTDHGIPYFGDAADLKLLIFRYKQWGERTKTALNFLKGKAKAKARKGNGSSK